jgi:hypothetical protein
MRKRILLRLCLLILIAGAGFWVLVWFIPSPRINSRAFGELQNGMSKAEVWTVLNCPPGDYGDARSEFRISAQMPEGIVERKAAATTEQWTSAKAAIRVWYDADDRMVLGVLHHAQPEEFGLVERLKRWLSSL